MIVDGLDAWADCYQDDSGEDRRADHLTPFGAEVIDAAFAYR